ncbi:MAG: hypothetical protein AAFR65_11210 [Pseudomonadota bacterium]
MKRIYKYQLAVAEEQVLEVPAGAEFIRLDGIDGKLWVWALVDPNEQEFACRRLLAFKTGGDIPDSVTSAEYIGCAAIFIQMELMLYFFEVAA